LIEKPYSKLIEILQSTLRQVERDAVLEPADDDLKRLKIALERTITGLDSRMSITDADPSESHEE